MQISKINMFNAKSNTIQNNNGTTLPIYKNINHSDSVSFGVLVFPPKTIGIEIQPYQLGAATVVEKLKALPFKPDFPDIAGRVRLSDKRGDSGVYRKIANPDEIRNMAATVAEYIQDKVLRIAEILEKTPKKDLPISDLHEHNNPWISFQIFPNTSGKSFEYLHNDDNGKAIESLAFRDGQPTYFSRTMQDHKLSFYFQDGELYRISKFEDQRPDRKKWGETMCLVCLDGPFSILPISIKTPHLQIRES